MSFSNQAYESPRWNIAADANATDRADFITKTYMHLVVAIGAFAVLEVILLNSPVAASLTGLVGAGSGWLFFLGLFMVVSWIARGWASSSTSLGMQYAGLSLYVVAQAILFVPLLYIASQYEDVIPSAGLSTLGLFAALTAVVFMTRQDFSWMRSILWFGGLAALGLIVCAVIFNFALGAIFTYTMIALACGYILYDTSNVLHHYRIGQHVAASLALFASVALLFWYIVRLFMSSRD